MAKAPMNILPTCRRLNFKVATLRLAAVVGLIVWSAPTKAEQYFASPTGNDANNCLTPITPCLTGQAAIKKMPLGKHGLGLAPGSYAPIDVYYGREVHIYGPLRSDGSCIDPTPISVKNISAQDRAIVWASCLTTEQISCRQYSIVDVANVVFNGEDKIAMSAAETCRFSTDGKLWISANIAGFASAQNYSTIYLAGEVIITRPGLKPAYFVNGKDSTIDMSVAVFSGYPLASGLRFILDHGVIEFPWTGGAAAIPGSGSIAKNFSVCRPCD